MSRTRPIYRCPEDGKNYYLVDACFLANKYLSSASNDHEKRRLEACKKWWKEIDKQVKAHAARVYIPDICIAEAFKVLAKHRYQQGSLSQQQYASACKRLGSDVSIPLKKLKASERIVEYHDISTNRDIIIAVDRFFEFFHKKGLGVSTPDLIILATAKYLMDFFDIPKKRLHIVSSDRALRDGGRRIPDVPYVYDPTQTNNRADVIFKNGTGGQAE